MVNWPKKIMKSVGDDLNPDEQLEAALFLQPAGMTKKLAVGGAIGGAIGAAVAGAMTKEGDGPAAGSIADGFPNPPVVLGLTSNRLLVWKHSQLSGKPKELLGTIETASLSGVTVEKGRLARPVTISFADGSALRAEAPKGTDPEGFKDAVTRLAS
jgi:hypothetical protein